MKFDKSNVGLIGLLVAVSGIIWMFIDNTFMPIALALLGLVLIAASQCQLTGKKKKK